MNQSLIQWALESLAKFKPNEAHLRRLAQHLSPEAFTEIVRYLYRSPNPHDLNAAFEQFFQSAAKSRFSEGEWAEALYRFVKFNTEHKIISQLDIMTGYLECAVVAPEAKVEQVKFPALVEYCLSTYGFENRGG